MIDPEVERELSNIRAQFDQKLASFQVLYDDRDHARKEALRIALENNEKRLDSMNEFRAALSDQSAQMMTRTETDAAGRLINERVEQNRLAVETQLAEITKPKWTLMLTLLSICLVMVGGIWALVGLKVDSSVAPVAVLAQQTQAQTNVNSERLRIIDAAVTNSTQADAISRVDREQLNNRLRENDSATAAVTSLTATGRADRAQLNERLRILEQTFAAGSAERRAQFAVITAKLIEIETQFCASDIVRNLMHASDMRTVSMLWTSVFKGQHFPTDNAYYPRVCNRPSSTQE